MREILFRAKRIDNGEWVEGFYSQLPKRSLGATIITNGDLCAEDASDYIILNQCKQHSNFSNAFPIEVVECEYYEIDHETLCQYTGLVGKNGNRIWENDIISINTYDYNEPQEDFFGKVVYAEGWGCWCIQQPGEEKPIPLCECEGSYLTERTVEGNAFDNPEMMNDDYSAGADGRPDGMMISLHGSRSLFHTARKGVENDYR